MVDLVFVVEDPKEWHAENLEIHSDHYSALKYFGPGTIAKIQENWACGVYYNPYVTVEGQLLKYGVVSTRTLNDDLFNWTHCYLAGRLHKPVLDVKQPINSRTVKLLSRNREAALNTALLMLPRYCTKFELYRTITEISYIGDFRMSIGENPNKVSNIVSAMISEFDKIYKPLLRPLEPLVMLDKQDRIAQETHPHAIFTKLMVLPHPIQRTLAEMMYPDIYLIDVEEALLELSYSTNLPKIIRKAIADVTRGSSIRQTLQGIATAGPFRSIRYGFEKLKKKASAATESEPEKSVVQVFPPSKPSTVSLTSSEIKELDVMQHVKYLELQKKLLSGEEKDPLVPSIIPSTSPTVEKFHKESKSEDTKTTAVTTVTDLDSDLSKFKPMPTSPSSSTQNRTE